MHSAIRMAQKLEPYDPFFYEEPIPPDNVDAMAEVQRSMVDFETELNRPAEHFSFAYSRSTPQLCRRIGELGIRSAMTGEGVVGPDRTDPLDLPRIEAGSRIGRWRFQTSGAYPRLSLSLFGRA